MIKKSYTVNDQLLVKLSNRITHLTGLYFPKEHLGDLEIKLLPAAEVFGFDNAISFFEWILEAPLSEKQVALLAGFITIGETYFFRDSHFFEALEYHVLPRILETNKESKKIRIWSAACCTGEEPYSIAIILHRLLIGLDDWEATIIGTDINPVYLEKAKSAIYKEWSFRSTSSLIKSNYFRKTAEGRYQLVPEILQMVKFFPLNLINDHYPSIINGTNELDLIICNNVLIYFSMSAIHKCVHQLVNSLSETGFLAVTPIEAPYISNSCLSVVKFNETTFFSKSPDFDYKPHKFVPTTPTTLSSDNQPLMNEVMRIELPKFLNLPNPVLEVNFSIPTPPPTKKIAKKQPAELEEKILEKILSLELQGKHKEKLQLLEKTLNPIKHNEELLLHQIKEISLLIKIYANNGKYENALEWCNIALKADRINAHLYYLKALISEDINDTQQAIKSIKQALCLDQNYIMAQFALANLYEKELDHMSAKHHYRNAYNLVKQLDSAHLIEDGDGMTAGQMRSIIEGIQ